MLPHPRWPWIVSAALIVGGWVVVAVSDRGWFGLHIRIGIIWGTVIGQVALVGAWSVFGPLPFASRITYAVAWLALLVSALNIWQGGDLFASIAILTCWVITQVPLWAVRSILNVRITTHATLDGDGSSETFQFGIRQLMMLTGVVGVLFGLVRIFLAIDPTHLPLLVLPILMCVFAVAMLPLLLAALLPRFAILGATFALLLLAAGLAFEIPGISELGVRPALLRPTFAFSAAWVLSIALVLQGGGYALRPPRVITKAKE